MLPAAHALVAELLEEAATTRRVLERVPEHRFAWQPHDKSMTLGQLALHIAHIPGAISRLSALDGVDASTLKFEAPHPTTHAELLRAFDESIASAKSFLSSLDETTAAAPWTMRAGERELFSVPRIGLMRRLALNHWYHHRGQLTVYLRLIGVSVPVVYGRSADENPFEGEIAS
jgi:uncharacterized damage-inducible protein DinB